ncbi:Na+/H+ antiporter subunit D [Afifella sp. IM 167]|uniref:Na+/H+ antiporter subunit D n=1 Tax=Afifella sp. IM 167 TaxID=2033586 RepID=UPI001CD03E76|nr:Na+/H+ antiporter subunit D [Afifella sp. IM 167]MBZ8133108.1 Na+/H+ antiporter subunit D [Afifella sp. IM 167]
MAGTAEAVDLAAAMITAPVAAADALVIAPTLITVLFGAVLLLFRKRAVLQFPIGIFALALLVVACAGILARVLTAGPIAMAMGSWLPPFGINFTADVLGASFAFFASLVALTVGVFATRDIDGLGRRYGFFPFLLLMMTGICNAFLTGDIFNLYVWFEVMLIASFGLMVLGNGKAQLDGAVRYALLNLLAAGFFLIATGYLYGALGTLNMADIALRLREPTGDLPMKTIAMLYILGFGMKAAAFPLAFWLPASYHTPSPAAGAIFAGLLTKVGAYALMRTMIMLMPAEHQVYADMLSWLAIGTILLGSFGAMAESDLRRMLGYIVISGIGIIFAGIALGSQGGLSGAILYAIHSMLVMTALYFAAGIAAHLGGSQELRHLGGLYGASPLLAGLMLALVFSAAALPPFSGFWAKVVVVQAALADQRWLLAGVVLSASAFTALAAGRAFAHAFWRGGPLGTPDGAEKAVPGELSPFDQRVLYGPIIALAGLTLVIGLYPAPFLRLAEAGAAGLLDPTPYFNAVFGGAP